MKDDKYTKELEKIISQMIKPIKNIPFNLVINALTEQKYEVTLFDIKNKTHKRCLDILIKVGNNVLQKTSLYPIKSKRANEVGNKIEPIVLTALKDCSIISSQPKSQSGAKKSVGYPDCEFCINNEYFYLECKTYSEENLKSSNRSFFLSPSDDFKITKTTVHFLIAFEMKENKIKTEIPEFVANSFKIISLDRLSCDVKFEFNSSNKKMYSEKNGANLLFDSKINK